MLPHIARPRAGGLDAGIRVVAGHYTIVLIPKALAIAASTAASTLMTVFQVLFMGLKVMG